MKKAVNILFVVYILLLLRITVFRNGFYTNTLFGGEINLIPFSDLWDTFRKNPLLFFYLFLGNIIWFIPFGLYVSGITDHRLLLTVFLGFGFSLFIEVMQYILSTGISEIDDIILNTAGSLAGAYISRLYKKGH